jgi:hypothetical protein
MSDKLTEIWKETGDIWVYLKVLFAWITEENTEKLS